MAIAEVSGRVNLIGEHTDYNDGFVLPTAIPQKTKVQVQSRPDRRVVAVSVNIGSGQNRIEYDLGCETRRGDWTDYVQGVTAVLLAGGFQIGGFGAVISSHVPMGSGLSSSAALEVALLRALRQEFQLPLDDIKLALLAQRVENEFVGARVGIMDQMACSLARWGEALFLDTKTLECRRVELPLDEMDLIVINSGVSHSNVSGGYNRRRQECEAVCIQAGVPSLRQLRASELPRLKELLPDILYRRAKHVITENDRVLKAVQALESQNLPMLGELFNASHASMRDDYEVSTEEIDALVSIAQSKDDVFGARMTGGGFGGSVVIVAKSDRGRTLAREIASEYRSKCRTEPTVLVPESNIS